MALTRTFLKGLGIEGLTTEHIQSIMDEHGDTVERAKTDGETAVNTLREKLEEQITKLEKQLEERGKITPDELDTMKSDLKDAREKLKGFDGIDVEDLQTKLADAEGKLQTATEEHATKEAEWKKDTALREKLAKETFSSDYAQQGVYNDLKEKVTMKDDKLEGYDDAMKALREEKPAAFAVTKPVEQDEGAQHTPGGKDVKSPTNLLGALEEKYEEEKS